MERDLLLVSNTKVAGGERFAHAKGEINKLFGDRKKITFIPYANPSGMGYHEYTQALAPTFSEMGYDLKMIDEEPIRTVRKSEAIFIGGGNTWKLLATLKEIGLLSHIREAVNRGIPYLGSSAGSNVAGLTIGNTNDMPAAESGRDALGLVPFNINPHYQDTLTLSPQQREDVLRIAPQLRMIIDHQGETRDDRLREYHALGNKQNVVALREGAMLRVGEDYVILRGTTGGKVFSPNREPIEYEPDTSLDFLLDSY